MTHTKLYTSATIDDDTQTFSQTEASEQRLLPGQRAARSGTGYRKQVGTTLEEAFLLSAKGKW